MHQSSMFTNTTLAQSQSLAKPAKRAKAVKHSSSLAISKTQVEQEKSKRQLADKHAQSLKTPAMSSGGIIKTVILPNEEVNRLGIEAEELRHLLHYQKQLYEEAIQAYHKSRSVREEEFRLKEQDFKEKIEGLKARLKTAEEANYKVSKDYFAYKHLVGKTRQRLTDE